MITGLNTNVAYDGVSYHVQTEDLGEKNPIILTLVFLRGAVVLREQLGYGARPGGEPSTAEVRTLMEAQHRRVVRRVAAGRIRSDSAAPTDPTISPSWNFLESVTPPPPKPIDDLIQEYLCVRRRTKRR